MVALVWSLLCTEGRGGEAICILFFLAQAGELGAAL